MEIQRTLDLRELLEKKSHFLLGPRSTGKTTLIRSQLKKAVLIDLLKSAWEQRLLKNPSDLEAMILAQNEKPSVVVIDEVQKVPSLLNEVHRLIEEKKWRFLLTGSSARKLKGENINLLAGRAWTAHLYPLTWRELGSKFKLEHYLLYGGLPQVYGSRYPQQELEAYAHTYLQEEIRAEAYVRKIIAFSRFLELAALSNTQLLNFTQIGSDTETPPSTIREYYWLLEDTLLGHLLPPWTRSKKRKAIQTAKFYFFDIGVTHALAQVQFLDRHSDLYGRAFEHFLYMEIKACLDYLGKKQKMSFWRSINGQEVDFILGDEIAIEVKSTSKVSSSHLKGIEALQEENICKNFYLVSQDPIALKRGNLFILPWQQFLEKLWEGKII